MHDVSRPYRTHQRGEGMFTYLLSVVFAIPTAFAQWSDPLVCANLETSSTYQITRDGDLLVWSASSENTVVVDGQRKTIKCRATVTTPESVFQDHLNLDPQRQMIADQVNKCLHRSPIDPQASHYETAHRLISQISRCFSKDRSQKLLVSNGYEHSHILENSRLRSFFRFLGAERGDQEFAFTGHIIGRANFESYEKFKAQWNANRYRRSARGSRDDLRVAFPDDKVKEALRLYREFMKTVGPAPIRIIVEFENKKPVARVFSVLWNTPSSQHINDDNSVNYWQFDGILNSSGLRVSHHHQVVY